MISTLTTVKKINKSHILVSKIYIKQSKFGGWGTPLLCALPWPHLTAPCASSEQLVRTQAFYHNLPLHFFRRFLQLLLVISDLISLSLARRLITEIRPKQALLCTRHCTNKFTFHIHFTDKTKEQRCHLTSWLHSWRLGARTQSPAIWVNCTLALHKILSWEQSRSWSVKTPSVRYAMPMMGAKCTAAAPSISVVINQGQKGLGLLENSGGRCLNCQRQQKPCVSPSTKGNRRHYLTCDNDKNRQTKHTSSEVKHLFFNFIGV